MGSFWSPWNFFRTFVKVFVFFFFFFFFFFFIIIYFFFFFFFFFFFYLIYLLTFFSTIFLFVYYFLTLEIIGHHLLAFGIVFLLWNCPPCFGNHWNSSFLPWDHWELLLDYRELSFLLGNR